MGCGCLSLLHHTRQELYLEINNLEDESLCRFAEMLESNKSLRVADLRMNNFEAEGLK